MIVRKYVMAEMIEFTFYRVRTKTGGEKEWTNKAGQQLFG